MYKIIVSPKARFQLKNTAKDFHKKALIRSIEELKDNPYTGKPLIKELRGKYSCKIGFYRIIYTVKEKDKTVFIITAGHRSTIYQ